ncbi:MAG: hypothetical protein PF442_01685, partial [Desulfobulbaceae bacterium]|nr:hypothetical protein [Desulfobulbaceae bacterium]
DDEVGYLKSSLISCRAVSFDIRHFLFDILRLSGLNPPACSWWSGSISAMVRSFYPAGHEHVAWPALWFNP